MSRQQTNQERKERSQTEGYDQAKPINDRLAGILLAIGSICGLMVAWGAADNHHTTMTVAIIVGVLCFLGAGYCHWTLDKRRDASKLESAKPTLPADPLPEAPKSIPLVIKRDVEAPRRFEPIPFDALPPPWLKYTEAMFYDVVWRWCYKREYDDTPRQIAPYCPECDKPLGATRGLKGTVIPGTNQMQWFVTLYCGCHAREYTAPVDGGGDFTPIRDKILERIRNGEFEKDLMRQRLARPGWISN